MPHFILEYSANLDGRVGMQALCSEILKSAVDTGVFEIGGVRVRAYRSETYAIADERKENAFINLTVRIGAGRDLETKKRAGNAIFSTMSEFLADELARPYIAVSLDIEEINPKLSWKKNWDCLSVSARY